MRSEDRLVETKYVRIWLGICRPSELINAVTSFTQAEIWKCAQSASRCFSELPFGTATADDADKPAVIRGVIDLIFEEANGWVIVDYNTDDITEADMPSAIEYYRGQLTRYAEYWSQLTTHQVTELGLYFTRLNHYGSIL